MKKACFLVFWIALLCCSCTHKSQKPSEIESLGRINSLTIIINDQLWNGEIGDSLRKKFAAPVDGLPQEEPLFTINQYPIKGLDGSKTNNRNIIIVKLEEKNNFEIIPNEFATPQNAVHISGTTVAEILEHIETNSEALIKMLKKTEIEANQKNIDKSLLNDKKIRKKFKIALHLPSTYKYVLNKPNFLWLKKEILSGNNSILIYKVPFKMILKNNNLTNNIVKMRDSIGALYIHSKAKKSRMITETSYAPYFFYSMLDNKRAYQTKGTWDLKGDFMSGSFINYAILDRKKKTFLVIEGFCYAPSTDKRDLMFELESIIKSVKFLK